jgi:hypothetical protein
MYTVIFVDTKGPTKLGRFEDKGTCRRAWKTFNAGAAILDESGAVLEHRGGITDAAKRKLDAYAEHLRRQGGMAAAAPVPTREAPEVASVEDEDDAEEPAPPPPPRPAPVAAPVAVVEPRPTEVTHAIHPTTGAVVVGDDAERLVHVAHAMCEAAGCTHPAASSRANTNPMLAGFCREDRKTAHDRSRGTLPLATVVAHLRAGTLPPPDPKRAALGRKSGAARRQQPAEPVARRAPKPARVQSPAVTLAAGLERVKRNAAVIEALGGVEAAEALAELVRESGGVAEVRDALAGLLDLARAA